MVESTVWKKRIARPGNAPRRESAFMAVAEGYGVRDVAEVRASLARRDKLGPLCPSYELQAEANVHGPRGVRDCAGGDKVGAGLGVGANVFECDAAR